MWGSLGGNRKIAWVKWEVVCRSKSNGGLGVENLEWFNLALLGKWVLRFLSDCKSLWASVVESKYGDFRKSNESVKDRKVWVKKWSSWWRDLVKYIGNSDWFLNGLLMKIGD